MSSAPGLRASAPPDAVLQFFRDMAAASAPLEVTEGGGGPERAQIVCGFLGCDLRPFNPVIEALPRALFLRRRASSAAGDRLSRLVDLALAESRERRAGSRCALLHLSELLFVEVVRRYLDSIPAGQTGWLAGLRDPITGHVLTLIHHRPAESWSLDRLAREIGVSRSLLAERFSELIGQPPMRYLTRWRIQLACRLLREDAAKVTTIARSVGYHSEAAFSRAFKAFIGRSPADFRRQSTPALTRSSEKRGRNLQLDRRRRKQHAAQLG
jgi:AraC-like DNA-binding protein